MSHTNYARKVLERFSMQYSRTILTPSELSTLKTAEYDSNSVDADEDITYRQAIVSIVYLMISTRQYIAYGLSILSHYCEKPLKTHWTSMKIVLRYIKVTITKGIIYGTSAP